MSDINPEEFGRRAAEAWLEQMRAVERSGGGGTGLNLVAGASAGYNRLLNTKSEPEIKREKEVTENLIKAKKGLSDSVTAFNTTIKGTDQGFSAFSGIVKGVGDGMSSLLRTIPLVGGVLGSLGQVITSTIGAVFAQADALFVAKDALAKFGTAGAFTTLEIRKFGESAGLTVKDLGKFTDAARSLGTGLVVLGGSSSEGVKALAKFTETTREQRMQFLALGITNEKLIENTAFYLDMMIRSGFTLKERDKTEKNLQKNAHDYIKNLLALAELTGVDLETAKKRTAESTTTLEFQAYTLNKEKEIAELRSRKGDADAQRRADELERELKFAREFVQRVGLYNEESVTAMARQLVTGGGAINEVGSSLFTSGMNVAKVFDIIQSKDVNRIAEFEADLFETVRRNLKNFSILTIQNMASEEDRRRFFLTKELLAAAQAYDARKKLTAEEIEAQKALADKRQAEDKIRADANEVLLKFRLQLDTLIATISPATIKVFGKGMGMLADFLEDFVVKGYFEKALKQVNDFIINLFSEEGRKKIMDDIKAFFKEIGIAIYQAVKDGIKDSAKNAVLTPFAAAAHEVFGAEGGLFNPNTYSKPPPSFSGKVTYPSSAESPVHDDMRPPGSVSSSTPPSIAMGSREDEIDKYLRFTGTDTGTKAHFLQLDSRLQSQVLAAAKEMYDTTGRKMQINSSFRSYDDQKRIYYDPRNKDKMVAYPGTSKHEKRLAIDVQNSNLAAPYLIRHGLVQPHPEKDHVHFERPEVGDSNPPVVAIDPSKDMAENFQVLSSGMHNLKVALSEKLDLVASNLADSIDVQERMLKTMQS